MKVGEKFTVQVHFKGNTGGEILILRYSGKIKYILEHRTNIALSGTKIFWTTIRKQFLSF
jgi:hypothetical protein